MLLLLKWQGMKRAIRGLQRLVYHSDSDSDSFLPIKARHLGAPNTPAPLPNIPTSRNPHQAIKLLQREESLLQEEGGTIKVGRILCERKQYWRLRLRRGGPAQPTNKFHQI